MKIAVIIEVFNFISSHLMPMAGLAAAAGFCFFVLGAWLFARKHFLANVSASGRAPVPGPARVSGVATGPYTLSAPISGQTCFLYQTTVWQQGESKRTKWEKVAEETLHLPFFVEDSAGQVLVEPAGAEFDLRQSALTEYGQRSTSLNSENIPPTVNRFLARHGVALDRPTRIEERALQPQMPLLVAGTLVKNPGVEVRPPTLPGEDTHSEDVAPMVTGNFGAPLVRPEIIKLSGGPAPSSTRQMTQQAKIAAALSRAGLTSPEGWTAGSVRERTIPDDGIAIENGNGGASAELTREFFRAAPEPAKDQPAAEAPPETECAFNLAPALVLMKGKNNAAFKISCPAKPAVANPLGWHSVVLVVGGTCLALTGVYILLFGRPLR